MGLVTLTQISNGEDADATTVDSNFDAIAAVINGAIEDANFGSSSPIVVSTTVAGLGATRKGKAGLLRVGSAPYEHLAVAYDDTYGKWVSAAQWTSLYGYDATDFRSTTHTAYLPSPCRLFVKNWKAIHDAGMRLQVSYSLSLATGDSGVQAQVGVNVYDHDATDTLNELTTGFDAQNTVSTTFVYISRDWSQPALTPTQAHGRLAIGWRPQANTTYAQVNDMSLGFRFVSS